jgi:hypothetical protein
MVARRDGMSGRRTIALGQGEDMSQWDTQRAHAVSPREVARDCIHYAQANREAMAALAPVPREWRLTKPHTWPPTATPGEVARASRDQPMPYEPADDRLFVHRQGRPAGSKRGVRGGLAIAAMHIMLDGQWYKQAELVNVLGCGRRSLDSQLRTVWRNGLVDSYLKSTGTFTRHRLYRINDAGRAYLAELGGDHEGTDTDPDATAGGATADA